MPDLKSELSKVITSWNEPDMPTTTAPTMTPHRAITANSTRLTFNYVRDNPGVTRVAAAAALKKLGVKESSSTSLISVMTARGNLRRAADGGLFATQNEYAPIPFPKPPRIKRNLPAAPQPEVVAPTPTPPEWTVESVIGNLNVRQALAVYMELRTVFGG
jgi:hypothetical protein